MQFLLHISNSNANVISNAEHLRILFISHCTNFRPELMTDESTLYIFSHEDVHLRNLFAYGLPCNFRTASSKFNHVLTKVPIYVLIYFSDELKRNITCFKIIILKIIYIINATVITETHARVARMTYNFSLP